MDLKELDEQFRIITDDLAQWIPDGIIPVDVRLLQRLDLLKVRTDQQDQNLLTRYFQVMETPERITLFNDDFVVWIVPEMKDDVPTTYTIVALRTDEGIRPEMAFSNTGIYNTSRMVLRVLEKLLLEIQETEATLNSFT